MSERERERKREREERQRARAKGRERAERERPATYRCEEYLTYVSRGRYVIIKRLVTISIFNTDQVSCLQIMSANHIKSFFFSLFIRMPPLNEAEKGGRAEGGGGLRREGDLRSKRRL